MPTRVLVLPVAGGRAPSITGVGCGRPDPSVVDAARAKDIAAATVADIALRHHGRTVRTDWEPLADGGRAGNVREDVAA
ncbi:hypothetical protein [Streptomyces virginiae]|uniref:hypothetical protein n=1 Tax=Streptomyces virginiae TaxID=1961 RepID=UPI002DBBB096|nr:hypothetical protein [Streptomyces sp. CMAA1738]MEC4572997.1 hypothetical protein [Streptomyces sp. CMAA1738]